MISKNKFALICIAITIILTIFPAQADDWLMAANGPSNNNTVSEEPDHPLEFKWIYETEGYSISPPVINGGFVYIGSNDRTFHKIDIREGKAVWKCNSTSIVQASPAIYNNTIFLSSDDKNLYALDPENCKVLQKYHTEGIFSKILIFNDTLFVGSDDNHLHAIEPSTGKVKWKFDLGNDIKDTFAVSNTGLYIGSLSGHLYALDLNNGEQLWEYETKGSIDSPPVLLDDNIYISSWDGHIYALNTNTGKPVWEKLLHSDTKMQLSAADKKIYVTSMKNPVYALDSSTGRTIWQTSIPEHITTPAIITPGHLYLGSDTGNISILNNENGELIKKYHKYDVSISSIAIASRMLFITGDNGILYTYGPEETDNEIFLTEQKTTIDNELPPKEFNPGSDTENSNAEQNHIENEKSEKDITENIPILSNIDNIIDRFSPYIPVHSNGYIPFLLLTSLIVSGFIYSHRRKKKNIENGVLMLARFNTKNEGGYRSGEAYSLAEEMFLKGKIKKGKEQLQKANAYYLKERPFLDSIEKLILLKKTDNGESDNLIKEAIVAIKELEFHKAKKLLIDTEEVINRENKLLQEGRGKYQKYNDMKITIQDSDNEQNVALANDFYNQLEELKNIRSMESELSNNLIQRIQNEISNYNFDEISKYIEQLKILIQEERPYLNMVKEIESIRKLDISTSGEMVKKALKQIERANYSEAEKLLLTAKKIVEQENILLKEIEHIQNINIPDMDESTFDQYKIMKELGEGKFEAVKRKITLAKHEKLKSALIEDIEDVLK